MNLKKIAPWNWFKHEQQEGNEAHHLPARRDAGLQHGAISGRPLADLQRQVDRLFDDFGRSRSLNSGPGFDSLFTSGGAFQPSIDVSESERSYRINVEVPGVEKDDLHVELEDDCLVLFGEKKCEHEDTAENYSRIERSYGSFRRVLNLPPDAVPGDIKAKFRNGILTLTMPRNRALNPPAKAIEIEVV